MNYSFNDFVGAELYVIENCIYIVDGRDAVPVNERIDVRCRTIIGHPIFRNKANPG